MRYFHCILFLLITVSAFAQKTYVQPPRNPPIQTQAIRLNPEAIQQLHAQEIRSSERQEQLQKINPTRMNGGQGLFREAKNIVLDPHTQLPIYVEGAFDFSKQVQTRSNIPRASTYAFLQQFRAPLHLEDPEQEFRIQRQDTDPEGVTHTRLYQYFKGLPVYGTEVIVHSRDGAITLFNGRYFATPQINSIQPRLSAKEAVAISRQDLAKRTTLLDFTPALEEITGETAVSKEELCIYFSDPAGQKPHLAYEIRTAANPLEKWTYLIDAHSGAILKKYNRVCSFHHHHESPSSNINWHAFRQPQFKPGATADGPTTAIARDLLGRNRTLNTYELGGTYYLLDASRSMWQGFNNDFSEFFGGILTADGLDRNLEDFEPEEVRSANNQWNDPAAVSGHYNAGIAYEYFRSTFGRNSINGSGGNIISFVNVADEDGGGLDNAFWNGSSMFYGNGRDAFFPLAAALDVAAHEMSHGVIQNTANLEYQGESGALNESFADVFGVLVDRDDWLLGEDVVRQGAFPTGALRNMQNPNNGGSRLGDRGWQPAHVDEQYFGDLNNGGVHINSGIVNRAFYLFASNGNVGKARAERVYYKALDRYLTRSSQFIDARLAIVRAAEEEYGTTVAAAAENAFSAVGIGAGAPTPPPAEAPVNEGTEYIMAIGQGGQGIYLTDLQGNVIDGANPLTTDEVLFKPSISDNGSLIAYINASKQLRLIQFNWSAGNFNIISLSDNPIWRRVAISKDGLKLAATTTDLQPEIFVFDLNTGDGRAFPLFNPTTAQGGINSGEVRYADGLEWDLSSQFVIYDAFNEVSGLFSDYTYFDIGSLEAWDNERDNYGNGEINKLFSSLPDNISIGNPAISKNSPNILAFDLIDDSDGTTAILGVDIETLATGTMANTNSLGFPNYSVDDTKLIYEDSDFFGDKVVKISALNPDKISAQFVGDDFLTGAEWPNWFSTGTRVISSTKAKINPAGLNLEVFPNPSSQNMVLQTELKASGPLHYEVFDLLGKLVYRLEVDGAPGNNTTILPIDQLARGTYILKMRFGQSLTTQKIIKH